MSKFPHFALLPSEIQDLIWSFALPGPRVLEYNALTDRLFPFSPAATSINSTSRYRALKTYHPIESPKKPGRCIGYADFSVDTILFSSLPPDVVRTDDAEEETYMAMAERIDAETALTMWNERASWDGIRSIALSVPVFMGTIWSGGGGLTRSKASPTLDAICRLPHLEAIAVVSTGHKELDLRAGQMESTWEKPNVWRMLTRNEAGAGWALLLENNLVENWSLEQMKEGEDSTLSWDDLRRKVWKGRVGVEVWHLGLETAATREELRTAKVLREREQNMATRKVRSRMSTKSSTLCSRGQHRRSLGRRHTRTLCQV